MTFLGRYRPITPRNPKGINIPYIKKGQTTINRLAFFKRGELKLFGCTFHQVFYVSWRKDDLCEGSH